LSQKSDQNHVSHAASAPIREQVGGPPLERNDHARERPPRIDGPGVVDLAVGPPHPGAVADGHLDLALALEDLLEALVLRELEEHALLAGRDRMPPVLMVEREALQDLQVADPDLGEPGHEGFHGGPSVLRHRGGGHAHTDRDQQER